ncbi:polyphenol oxidase family protein [Arcanobacterium canis]
MGAMELHSMRGEQGIITYGFTTRRGGVSTGEYGELNLGQHVGDNAEAVALNRQIVGREFTEPIVWMNQIHSDIYRCASQAADINGVLTVGDADAVIIERGQAAAVMVADCLPLLLLDVTGTRAAVVHVGRAGLEKEIALKVRDAMCERGTAASAFRAIVGPHICGRCYEVPVDMMSAVGARFPHAISQTSWGTPALDLAAGLADQLGMELDVSSYCTRESELYFSHRRSGALGKPAGRFAGIVEVATHPGCFHEESLRLS